MCGVCVRGAGHKYNGMAEVYRIGGGGTGDIGGVFCQAEDGIRDLVRSRGLGDVYKRQC
mgnify:CR=1 FL=1